MDSSRIGIPDMSNEPIRFKQPRGDCGCGMNPEHGPLCDEENRTERRCDDTGDFTKIGSAVDVAEEAAAADGIENDSEGDGGDGNAPKEAGEAAEAKMDRRAERILARFITPPAGLIYLGCSGAMSRRCEYRDGRSSAVSARLHIDNRRRDIGKGKLGERLDELGCSSISQSTVVSVDCDGVRGRPESTRCKGLGDGNSETWTTAKVCGAVQIKDDCCICETAGHACSESKDWHLRRRG